MDRERAFETAPAAAVARVRASCCGHSRRSCARCSRNRRRLFGECRMPSAVLVGSSAWVLRSDESFWTAVAEAAGAEAGGRRHAPAPRVRRRAGRSAARAARRGAFSGRTRSRRSARRPAELIRTGRCSSFAGGCPVVDGTRHGAAVRWRLCVCAAAFACFGTSDRKDRPARRPRHLELLKTWPVKARPSCAARCSGPAWCHRRWPGSLLRVGYSCRPRLSRSDLELADRSAPRRLILAPALYSRVHDPQRAALLFPAWIPVGNQRPRGLDAMGQRLILFGGVLAGWS